MTILDPCMSLERIKKNLGVFGVLDMRQLLLKEFGFIKLLSFITLFPVSLGKIEAV